MYFSICKLKSSLKQRVVNSQQQNISAGAVLLQFFLSYPVVTVVLLSYLCSVAKERGQGKVWGVVLIVNLQKTYLCRMWNTEWYEIKKTYLVISLVRRYINVNTFLNALKFN